MARSPKATIVIDDEESESGVMLECSAKILPEKLGEEWRKTMRESKGWRNDKNMAIIELAPEQRASWFPRS